MSQDFLPKLIEPNILPLVNAINDTKLFKTFSSCEGHFLEKEQTIDDRNFADVRFELLSGVSLKRTEKFIHDLIQEFGNGVVLSYINAYKLYTPKMPRQKGYVFVIEIHPLNRFDTGIKKRKETNMGIRRTTKIICKINSLPLDHQKN